VDVVILRTRCVGDPDETVSDLNAVNPIAKIELGWLPEDPVRAPIEALRFESLRSSGV
jgi:hypothetical protein